MSEYSALTAAIVGLLLGPILAKIGQRQRGWVLALDGFMLVSLGGLGLVFLLPSTIQTAGYPAVLAAVLGFLLPSALEGRINQAKGLTLGIVFLGLCVHNAVDGAALSAPVPGHAHGLDVAIVLHRLPVGLLVFVTLRDRLGPRMAFAMVCVLAVVTYVGFAIGGQLTQGLAPVQLALFEAFVVGALVHVVMHRPELSGCSGHGSDEHTHGADCSHPDHHAHDHRGHGHHAECEHHEHRDDASECVHEQHTSDANEHDHHEHSHHEHSHHEHGPHEHIAGLVVTHDHRDDQAIWGFFGASLGLVTLSLFEELPTISASAGRVFVSLALEAAPALLLAYAFAGLLNALLVERTLSWLAAGNSLKQATKGVAFGLPLPICSCGVVPLYQTLVQRGAPGTAALAFLISTPEIGVDAILISLPLLGGELTVIRIAAAVLVALGLALLLGPRIKPKTEQIAPQQLKTESLRARIQTGLRYGFGPLVDHTLPWMLVGLSIAAYAAPLFDAQTIAALSPFWQVPVFALLGIPMYVCASAATPLAAIAIMHQVSPGAALAFLLTGPATNVTTFGVLRALHGRSIAILFGILVASLAIALGWLINWTFLDAQVSYEPSHAHTPLEWVCLALLGGLMLISLFRQGPRGMVNHIAH
ncbi:MAG: permease [Bradymonadia bacterium]